jgi:vacuolar-type H+-ATPase subunit F/Vma7
MIAIGPESFTLPFGALGFETAGVDDAGFLESLRGVLRDANVGLVVCSESMVSDDELPEFEELCDASDAAVVVVPDGREPRGIGYNRVRRAVERAAGVDLLGDS